MCKFIGWTGNIANRSLKVRPVIRTRLNGSADKIRWLRATDCDAAPLISRLSSGRLELGQNENLSRRQECGLLQSLIGNFSEPPSKGDLIQIWQIQSFVNFDSFQLCSLDDLFLRASHSSKCLITNLIMHLISFAIHYTPMIRA